MTYAFVDQTCVDDFSVVDPDTGLLVGSLVQGDFTVQIFDPTGSSDTTNYTIEEIGTNSGYYRLIFTPDAVGIWLVSIIHTTYFPWGKSENYSVVTSTFFTGSGGATVEDINKLLIFIFGLY